MNSYKSVGFISWEITSRIQHGEKLAPYGFETGPYNYYMEGEELLSHFLKSPERVFCLIRSRDLEKIRMKEELPLVELFVRYPFEQKDIVLNSNR